MAGNDIDRENQASGLTQITGRDESYKAAVILDDDGQEKLLVKTDSDTNATISNKIEVAIEEVDITLPSNNVTLFTRTTTTKLILSALVLNFSSNDVIITLEVDGQQIFEIDCDLLNGLLNVNSDPFYGAPLYWNSAKNALHFAPLTPLVAFTDIVIRGRRRNGGNKKLEILYTAIGEE